MTDEAIFHQAIDTPAPERAAFLDAACAGDDAQRGRIELMMRAHENPGSFLQAPAGDLTATAAYSSAGERAGSMIGPYKLLQKLGEGGMGEVWMAEQTAPVQRKVALKIIKPGMDTRQVVARFEAERQALALMDHANIARVFDGGSTESGRPFFVMELVKGVPITKYCDDQRLSPRDRLELFAQACQAIQHAHTKGIIHRDLKPSNVLVAPYDGRPVVKVIDFGVAKAAGQRLTEKTLFTEFGSVVGTLEYMSPEQAELNNQDIDTRSDVYSLGVLLYELLTGTTPLTRERLKRSAFTEMLRAIREEEPPRPSTRLSESRDALPSISAQRQTEPAKLTKLVRGELDWIVMKALEKDRNRRYDSANAVAMDLQRYLADEPVQACPPSTAYRLRKFARRNRGAVLAASLLLLTLLGGIVGTSWKWAEAIQARNDEADLRRETNRLLLESEWMLYASRINLAQQAWESNNASLAIHYLNSCRPDFRGWEHDYLFTLFHSNHRTYSNRGVAGDSDGVASLAVSRDGKRIASTGLGTVNVWNADTGERILNFAGLRSVVSVAFSPDGKRIASGGHDNTVIVWNADTGEPLLSLSGHKLHIQCVAFSPDGKRIAAGADDTIKVWDAVTGELVLTVPTPTYLILSVAWSADGKRIVGGQSGNVHVWDAHTGKSAVSPRWNNSSGKCVAFNPKGGVIASGGDDRRISLWDVSTGQRIRTLEGHTESVTSVAFSHNGQFIVSGSEDKTVRIWDIYTGLEVRTLKGHMDVVTSVAPMPDGQRIVSGSRDGTIKVWDALWGEGERQETRILLRHSGSIIAMALSPDGRRVASGRSNGPDVELWDVSTPWRTKLLRGHKGSLHGIAFSPDGKRIATGNGDRTVKVWDADTFKELVTLIGHTDGGTSVTWSPDGSRVVSGSWDHTVRIWDATTGQEVRTLAGHTGSVYDVAWSPDGHRILSGSGDKTVKIWDAATGAEIRAFTGHDLEVYSVAWSPDGKRIFSGSGDKTVKIWDAATGAEIRTLRGHGDRVRRVAVIPNHRRIVTGGWDGTLKVWDTDTGYETMTLNAHTTVINNIVVSADGTLIISGGGDRTVKAWYAGLSAAKP